MGSCWSLHHSRNQIIGQSSLNQQVESIQMKDVDSGRLFYIVISISCHFCFGYSWCHFTRFFSSFALTFFVHNALCFRSGAKNGLTFYLKPNWSKIREFDVSSIDTSSTFNRFHLGLDCCSFSGLLFQISRHWTSPSCLILGNIFSFGCFWSDSWLCQFQ